ncbi:MULTISPECIES: EAL domain-containing protein [unclassified Variovorax]|uniref:EAL domain-containing response regulator n=1 Tax=unclassified Variovorax TaxID=663243 RepID=UPI002577D5D2|nr:MULTISPECIES: EAL domain-containing protein [unclassified Variovorax]MDM0087096.1 EAL domain-containing protein [Variovorax sp. J22G40]MDM0144647.1 EAL domain-containing protein [Variovorax sp. J2P1-31]
MSARAATILIVDDQLANRRLLEALLAPEGYTTWSAASGREGLARIALEAPDLILLDVMMPDMDGHTMARLLKSRPATSSIPIIMVTALVDRDSRLRSLEAGAEDVLSLPVDRAELWLRVRNLLRLKALSDFQRNHGVILEQEVRTRTADLQRFRTAMDATADGIFLIDRATLRFVELNATACSLTGYSREELLQRGPADLGDGEVDAVRTIVEDVVAGHATHRLADILLRRKDGVMVPVEVTRTAHRFGDSWAVVVVVRDITARKKAERRLHQMAHYDSLTGLPNRALFYEVLRQSIAQASDGRGQVAVLFIDLDHFKKVNDTLGHPVGDQLLVQFSDRLWNCLQLRDAVGRLGGDEFAVILVRDDPQAGAVAVAHALHEALREPFVLGGRSVVSSASVGISIYPDDAPNAEQLMQYADTAMYQAKQSGRNTSRFFTPQMNADALTRLELEMALRHALDHDEFELHYQPKVEVASGRVVGVEALLRWNRPGHGVVSPAEFIPVLEDCGLIVRAGAWVIAAVCRQIRLWRASAVGDLQVAVNIAQRQFVEGDLEATIAGLLEVNGVPARLLELELTESSLMANTAHTVAVLQGLRRRGLQISVDDFGTGYSSLAYLRRFPIDKLKIDIDFIRDITTRPDDAAITLAIIGLAHSLKLEVIAEGVETAAQLAFLRQHGCDQVQGYYFSRPLPLAALEALLHDGRGLERLAVA